MTKENLQITLESGGLKVKILAPSFDELRELVWMPGVPLAIQDRFSGDRVTKPTLIAESVEDYERELVSVASIYLKDGYVSGDHRDYPKLELNLRVFAPVESEDNEDVGDLINLCKPSYKDFVKLFSPSYTWEEEEPEYEEVGEFEVLIYAEDTVIPLDLKVGGWRLKGNGVLRLGDKVGVSLKRDWYGTLLPEDSDFLGYVDDVEHYERLLEEMIRKNLDNMHPDWSYVLITYLPERLPGGNVYFHPDTPCTREEAYLVFEGEEEEEPEE